MMISFSLIFVLSVFGIAETAYLIRQRKVKERPVCIFNEECHKVLESKYNKILGVNNDVLGLIFYILISFLTILLLAKTGPQALLIVLSKIFIFAGALFSIALIFIQWRLIKAWCFWCLLSAATTILMAIIILLRP